MNINSQKRLAIVLATAVGATNLGGCQSNPGKAVSDFGGKVASTLDVTDEKCSVDDRKRAAQKFLKYTGHYKGAIDGVTGRGSKGSWDDYKKDKEGLEKTPLLGDDGDINSEALSHMRAVVKELPDNAQTANVKQTFATLGNTVECFTQEKYKAGKEKVNDLKSSAPGKMEKAAEGAVDSAAGAATGAAKQKAGGLGSFIPNVFTR
ncbi:MAG: hypothetical protein H6868_02640 [Rhodospirillales bacterium]|nr:hypothetical protein [Rhodospirillales bacterium]